MLKTILKRVLQCIPTLFIVVTFTFVLTRICLLYTSFDILLPYQFRLSDNAVRERLKEFVANLEGHRYFAVIQVDHSYVGTEGAKNSPCLLYTSRCV